MNTTITTDFYLTAYLLSENIPLVKHTRSNNKSTFEFTGDNISEIMEKYYSGNAMVSINKYAEAMRELKNIMYNDTSIHQPINNYERKYS